MKLSELSCGESGIVTHLSDLPTATRKKLMVMGLLPNTEITVVRFAPLGDPLQVRVRGVNIALRKQIAADIEVEAH
ncbi:ferrous iron transport protein A [Photobacterium profundum]|jgi:ferrous iron transport protein A|uniref:Ferrous iron transport protein A n=4 Tax=Photobacterium TaxID=657 RepID=Q6LTA7_PHOPR|nr:MULTISPECIES: FeoA family protein [Photobacterium]EAS43851.1 putative ferrous iron transport protein A [Photobacterium profundum 3TCK]PSU51562.1 ferrous iron transport protein A [Photobacterium frigidiphilum]PSV48580.1 ferrous iron transport protein A [Photobacterium indicum]PSV64448.1 ferrous iron transport protein A [Photobacterium profundum]CAG19469.1 putative ferrous iron transport protein A [Photobacterium profundum SS9]